MTSSSIASTSPRSTPYSAVAVRATIEHYAGSVGIPVGLEAPADSECRAGLLHLLGEGLPVGFTIRGSGLEPGEPVPGSVIVAATLVPGYLEADEAPGTRYGLGDPLSRLPCRPR